ncbi:hypothetical protein DXG01_015133 [Tephrocybe rancida]|nr:hypothetical protein DXG01_015133 [Tephrocybe rancida]
MTLNGDIYINLVSFTILYYDYALTLPAEIDRFWSTRTISWVSGFYYLNRYLTLFGHIPVVVQNYWAFEGPSLVQVSTVVRCLWTWGEGHRKLYPPGRVYSFSVYGRHTPFVLSQVDEVYYTADAFLPSTQVLQTPGLGYSCLTFSSSE